MQDTNWKTLDRLVYDFSVKGYDTSFFKTTTGTPTVNSGDLRLNAAACASYSQYLHGDFHFQATIATTPSAGEAKHWGLRHPGTTKGSMYFDIAGAVFSFKSYNEDNTVTSTTVVWNSGGQTWEAASIDYRILWTEEKIKAYVGGILVATHQVGDNNLPLPLRISNSDADNMDVDYILANKVAKIIS